jgi:hypothetical protein
MALPEWDIEIEAGSNVRDPLGQGWSDDANVVELQHFAGMQCRLSSARMMGFADGLKRSCALYVLWDVVTANVFDLAQCMACYVSLPMEQGGVT